MTKNVISNFENVNKVKVLSTKSTLLLAREQLARTLAQTNRKLATSHFHVSCAKIILFSLKFAHY